MDLSCQKIDIKKDTKVLEEIEISLLYFGILFQFYSNFYL